MSGLPGPKGDTGATGATGATGPRGPEGRYIAYATRGRFLFWQTVICVCILASLAIGGKALIEQGNQNDKTETLSKTNSVLIARLDKLVRDSEAKDKAEKEKLTADAKKGVVLCKRSLRFAPPLGKDAFDRGVFDKETYDAFLATLAPCRKVSPGG